MTDALIGRHLDEYRLENLLGQGGMARVYRGLDTGLHRYAAIKIIDTPHQQDETYIARFEREARAIAALDHPHIVTVYRYGRAENLLYLAMKYIEGADLHAILTRYEQDSQFMPFTEITRLLREMGSALDYAHSQGIIHRDVKPSNVMLDGQGRSYITDFGLALLADVGTRGEILGSPHYIAPEQAVSSAGAVPQSDLYALGVILFRMVTGRLPFAHDDLLELLMLHMTASPPFPHAIRPEVSPALEAVMLQALTKEPHARFQSGQALADAVDGALAKTAVISLAAAPMLTIADRVALDMETIPPLLTATPPIPALQSTAPSPPAPGFPVSLSTIGGTLLLLAVVAIAIFLLRGQANLETPPAAGESPNSAMATTTAELVNVVAPVETPTLITPDVEMPTVTAVASATLEPSPAATVVAVPPEPATTQEDIYLPMVSAVAPVISMPLPASTETASPSPTTPPLTVYRLLIATNKEDSLFLVNQSSAAFPLDLLRLGQGNGAIQGTEWGIGQLETGNCVTAWKEEGNPKPPNIDCNQVGARVVRRGTDRFWKSSFDVFYDGQQVGVCDLSRQCLIEITK